MKTFRILLIGILLIVMSAHAQKIYIRGGLGVAVSTAATYNENYSVNSSNALIITSKKQGYGTGLPFVLAAGYNLSEHFSLELGVNYLYGFSMKQTFLPADNNTSTNSGRGQMLSIVPALVMSLPLDKFKPYARIGLILGVLNSYTNKNHYEQYNVLEKPTTEIIIDSKIKDYGGVAVGVQTAIGTEFALSDLISLFGEIQANGISYAPKHGKFLEYSENGVDKMGTRTVNDNQWNFSKEVDQSKTISSDQPREYTKVNLPFGNVGIQLGVKVNL